MSPAWSSHDFGSTGVLPSFVEHKQQATFSETDTEVPIRNFFY